MKGGGLLGFILVGVCVCLLRECVRVRVHVACDG